MPERPKGADCKSAGGAPSEVQILPPPPGFESRGREGEGDEDKDRSQVFRMWKQKLLHHEKQG